MARLAVTFLVFVLFLQTTMIAHATTYKFTVSCEYDRFVIIWKTGVIDPGREWLRVATGTKYSNCSTSDFNQVSDSHLRVEAHHSHEGAIIQGVPLLGTLICGIFRC